MVHLNEKHISNTLWFSRDCQKFKLCISIGIHAFNGGESCYTMGKQCSISVKFILFLTIPHDIHIPVLQKVHPGYV
jgi:hypothetical protein